MGGKDSKKKLNKKRAKNPFTVIRKAKLENEDTVDEMDEEKYGRSVLGKITSLFSREDKTKPEESQDIHVIEKYIEAVEVKEDGGLEEEVESEVDSSDSPIEEFVFDDLEDLKEGYSIEDIDFDKSYEDLLSLGEFDSTEEFVEAIVASEIPVGFLIEEHLAKRSVIEAIINYDIEDDSDIVLTREEFEQLKNNIKKEVMKELKVGEEAKEDGKDIENVEKDLASCVKESVEVTDNSFNKGEETQTVAESIEQAVQNFKWSVTVQQNGGETIDSGKSNGVKTKSKYEKRKNPFEMRSEVVEEEVVSDLVEEEEEEVEEVVMSDLVEEEVEEVVMSDLVEEEVMSDLVEEEVKEVEEKEDVVTDLAEEEIMTDEEVDEIASILEGTLLKKKPKNNFIKGDLNNLFEKGIKSEEVSSEILNRFKKKNKTLKF